MDANEEELVGKPADEAPKQEPTDERCMGKRTKKEGEMSVFVGYCKAWPGRGTDHVGEGRCTNHGGSSTGAPKGNDNATTHGAFKEHFRSDLTGEEQAAIDDLVSHLTDINDERAIAAEAAAEALMKYKRSADSRFLREARQWFADFNLIPNEDVFEASGPGGAPMQVVIQRERYDD